jgi:hypothetical protein
MQHSPTPNAPPQQFNQQVQYALYLFVSKPGWTRQQNQPNHEGDCTFLESPPSILELEDRIRVAGYHCTSSKRSILLSGRIGATDIGQPDLVESNWSLIQEKKKFILGRCYQGHFLHFASVNNSSGPSLRVLVRVRTELLPKWWSWLSPHLKYQFGYSWMDISQSVWIGRVVSGSPSGSICRFI